MSAYGRLRQARLMAQDVGAAGLAYRAVGKLERALATRVPLQILDPSDVADSDQIVTPQPHPGTRGTPLEVGWLTTPPGLGSGGHTTMFRMIEALERAGHHCTVYLYDRSHGDLAAKEDVIRKGWPRVQAPVRPLGTHLQPANGFVATSWQTAHALARRDGVEGRRFYFVQDFEPYFYARGSEYSLAEDTYRFGFHGITAGRWLSGVLSQRFGMACDPFPFGADTDVYRVGSCGDRDGVVFYAKPDVPRRAFDIGVLALTAFHRSHPDVPIHAFGSATLPVLPFPVANHGVVGTAELNNLYNRCFAGLALSLTNVSLIPWELLAAGAVPVVNDDTHNRLVLDNPHVAWSRTQPAALAATLSRVYADRSSVAPRALSASVAAETWDAASTIVTTAFERELYGD